MATAAPTKAASTGHYAGFCPVHSNLLRALNKVRVDLFVLPEGHDFPVLLCKADLQVTDAQVEEISQDKSKRLFVRQSDYQSLSEQLLRSVDDFIHDASIPQAERFALLQSAAAAEVQHACTLIDPGKYVDVSKSLAGNIVSLLHAGQVLPAELFRMAQHDYRTFAHVTNVSCYSVLMGSVLGIRDEELNQLAVAAMLHDVGKRRVSTKILRKAGALTPDERRTIEAHPTDGYKEVVRGYELTTDQLMVVYQHHERMDGSGYPVGILGEDIHPWARLVAIVDVFDAMTSNRTYRTPASPSEVLEYLQANAGSHFDKEMVACWTQLMSQA